MNKIYTVIVTYNGMLWIDACLSSLKNSSVPSNVIVVDNKSTDDTVSLIRSRFPEVHIIESNQNLGFGKANNIGMAYSLNDGASHVFLLNQDARLDKMAFEHLLKANEELGDCGIISPIHWNWKGDELEFYFSKFIYKNPNIIADFFKSKSPQAYYEIPFVNAAAWFIPKSVLMNIGGFDPIFHHYGEDYNYSQRLVYHGYKTEIVTKAHIFHDSNKRVLPTDFRFSEAYFRDEVKKLQMRLGNLNIELKQGTIVSEKRKLKRLMMNSVTRLNFKDFNGYLKKYKIFEKAYGPILKSREINVQKGVHYLKLKNQND